MQANTVTFTAADGKTQSFPIDFLLNHGAVIASKVNGDDVLSVMGAFNQLWIPGIPAKYFIRDIVGIEFSYQEEVPKLDDFVDDGRDFTNRPNVSVKAEYTGYVGEPLGFEGFASDFDKSIIAVEYSLDEGAHWTRHEIEGAVPEKWVYWYFDWTPRDEGMYRMLVRAVNEDGTCSPIPASHAFQVGAARVAEV